jgi:hypothetical protein
MSYDIKMTTDDTLELDAIINEWSTPSSAITVNPQGSLRSDSHSLNGFETKTGVFDPDKAGEYEIKINGQILSINVKDASVIPDSALARYEFEQSVSDSWNDNDLIDNTSEGYRTGKIDNYAKSLDGNDDYLTLPFSFSPSDDFSFVGWVYFDSFSEFNPLAAQRDSFSTLDWQFYYDSTSASSSGDGWKLDIGEGIVSANTAAVSQSTNVWTHIGLTKGSDEWTIYQDGTEILQVVDSTSWTESDSLYLGTWSGGSGATSDCGLDHIDWFNDELTAIEVTNHKNTGSING